MAISYLSTKELERISTLAYDNKVVQACLAYDPGDTVNAESTVAEWQAVELTQGTFGYYPSNDLLTNSYSDTTGVLVSYPSVDFSFTAVGFTLTFDKIFIRIGSLGTTYTVTNTERSTNTLTVTTSAAHGLIATDFVYITGTTSAAFDGFYEVLSAPTTTTFTVVSTGTDVPSQADTGTVQLVTFESNIYGYIDETPDVALAPGATQTYRCVFSVDD